MEFDLEYVILQSKYRKLHSNKPNIFPNEWYNIREYEIKKNILKECIAKKNYITESKNYPIFHELALKLKKE